MLPRPRFRLPLWMAVAIVVGLYVARSGIRGWDFRPDLPVDAIVAGLFVAMLVMVAYVRTVLDVPDEEDRAASGPPPPEGETRGRGDQNVS